MTATLETPVASPPDPTRSRTGRTLAWVGAVVGALAIVWGALNLASLVARQETSGTTTLAAAPTVELVADGAVRVHAASAADVRVAHSARYAFVDPHWSVTSSDDRLVVAYRCAWRYLWNCDTSLDVTLPVGTRVVVRSSDGDVVLAGTTGGADLRTSNGAVDVRDVTGDLVVRSSNGDVSVVDVAGAVRASSSNGAVTVHRAQSVDARSSNGRVEVDDVAGAVVADTSNGGIEVSRARADVRATTSNGTVTVYGTGEPVALDMDTSNGRMTIEGPTDPTAAVQVFIRSSNGDVRYLSPRD